MVYPPKINPRVDDAQPPGAFLTTDKSPKPDAFPVVAISIKLRVLVADGV